jgi:small subunit ribosomal protein S6
VKQKYETVVIFDGSLSDETVQKENGAFEEFLKVNTEFEKVDIWGKKNMAYPIGKKKSGVYYYYQFLDQSEKNVANKIEKHFKLNDSVLRHLTVVREEQKIVERKRIAPIAAEESDEEGGMQL